MEKNEQDLRKSEKLRLSLLDMFMFKMPFGTQVERSLILSLRWPLDAK